MHWRHGGVAGGRVINVQLLGIMSLPRCWVALAQQRRWGGTEGGRHGRGLPAGGFTPARRAPSVPPHPRLGHHPRRLGRDATAAPRPWVHARPAAPGGPGLHPPGCGRSPWLIPLGAGGGEGGHPLCHLPPRETAGLELLHCSTEPHPRPWVCPGQAGTLFPAPSPPQSRGESLGTCGCQRPPGPHGSSASEEGVGMLDAPHPPGHPPGHSLSIP